MRIYTAYSTSHKPFLPWFNTIKDVEPDVEIIYNELGQKCITGEYGSEGWEQVTYEKLEKIIQIFNDTTDKADYFVYSDVDIQFFKPITRLGEKALLNHDIVFQNDYAGSQCTGFFYCRKTPQTLKLFEEALSVNCIHKEDQTSVQEVLKKTTNLRWALLPIEFFTFGMFHTQWGGQEKFQIPKNIAMHHANWVKGIPSKLKLLEVVRSNYNQKLFF